MFRVLSIGFGLNEAVANKWYNGIDAIKVFSPLDSDSFDWRGFYEEMKMDQFSDKRWAVLLTHGEHAADVGVGFYTSLYGVGKTRSDVKITSFYAEEGPVNSLQNFWRSVEGVTTTNASITWSTSQSCPVRRVDIQGDLYLAECDTCWSSGGYLADARVSGRVVPRTQQQFFFRNCDFGKGVDTSNGVNFVFLGNSGNMSEQQDKEPKVSVVDRVPELAEKPFLVEEDGDWSIAVPAARQASQGPGDESKLERSISMEDVYVAKDGDTAEAINAGIVGKQALLLTPGIYGMERAVQITEPNFVVLGIGFATLVNHQGDVALSVEAADVRVAGVFFDAGSHSSEALLRWSGDRGFLHDAITRMAATSYERNFHSSCSVPSTDTHVQIDGDGVTVDHTWIWHADHDDCDGQSDEAFSGHGLLVNGNNVTAYGLMVEHTMRNMVQWNGEGGSTFFYQSEFPYNQPNFGSDGYHGYAVAPTVKTHQATGIGSYVIAGRGYKAFSFPSSAQLTNAVGWCINCPAQQQFDAVLCVAEGAEDEVCYMGDCEWDKCRVRSLSDAGPATHVTANVTIESVGSPGTCLGLLSAAEDDGTEVAAAACGPKEDQAWRFQGLNFVHRAADGSDKCLDLRNGNTTGGVMQIWYCLGNAAQQYGYDEVSGNIYLAGSPKKCVTLADGGGVDVRDCDTSLATQQWNLRTAGTGTTIMSV